jgi:uncharacterized protein (UPF0332 family)
MTDNETLLAYRIREAEESLTDAHTLLDNQGSLRTVINRSYYAAFYGALAFFIKFEIDVRTSKHAGMISLFDKEAIHTGKLAVEYSRMLHRLFEARLESDYKEFVQHTEEEAKSLLAMAECFVAAIKESVV